MMTDITGYIALGSNKGDREKTLRQAVMLMDELNDLQVVRLSHWIESAPVGGPAGQGPYLNGVAEIRTSLEPLELLAELLHIEAVLGRDRSREVRWGPRTCDLDILLLGDRVIQTPQLTVPHPRMHERRFVLQPLSEIAPNVVHSVLNKTIIQLLAELP